MKPYLAILIDSFWETVTSKVLWALLVGWTVLLASLAPFGYITESSYRIARGDVINRIGLAQKMAKGLTRQGTPAQKAISKHLSAGLKKQLQTANAIFDDRDRNERFSQISPREMVSELNATLDKRDLYDAEAFPTAERRRAISSIVAKPAGKRTEAEVEALNRQLIQIVYSADLRAPRSEELWIGYAGIKLGDSLPADREKINAFIEGIALQYIIRLGLSFVAVFVGLIVTSPMIPETFRSGSLHLLLSKPVSRPLIYLTKFFGGTLFVLFNIAYLLVGLYVLVGWRLGIWNAGLIYCIPLLLFVFVIFYSVSALVGLIWNNAIISIVVCIVFWVGCLIVGVLESSLRIPAEWTPRIVRFTELDDDLLAVTQAGDVKIWNDKFQVWQPVADLHEGASGRVLGPLVDKQRKRLVMRSDFLDPIGGYSTHSRNFVYADLSEAAASELPQPKNAEEARKKPHWPSEKGIEPPMLMIDLIPWGDQSLAISRNGIFEIDWAAQEAVESAKSTGGIFGGVSGWLERFQPKPFKDLTPDGFTFEDSVRVVAPADHSGLFVYNGNEVDALTFDQESGKFVVASTLKFEDEEQRPGLIAAGSRHCVVIREKSPMLVLPRDLSKIEYSVPLPDDQDVRQLQAIAQTDRISIVTHEGNWYVLNGETGQLDEVACPWQGSITGVTWLDEQRVWVGIKPNRAALWNASTGEVARLLVPAPSRLELFYRWIARPLYLVNPKPSSLNGVLQRLLSKDSVGQTQLFNNDLAAARVEVDLWQPILSNLAFVIVLLSLGCIYVSRREY